MIGDGRCDTVCNTALCDFDGGDCAASADDFTDGCPAMSGGAGYKPFAQVNDGQKPCLRPGAGGGLSLSERQSQLAANGAPWAAYTARTGFCSTAAESDDPYSSDRATCEASAGAFWTGPWPCPRGLPPLPWDLPPRTAACAHASGNRPRSKSSRPSAHAPSLTPHSTRSAAICLTLDCGSRRPPTHPQVWRALAAGTAR